MKSHRLARVAEVVREVASKAILFELRDPRIKPVTVTRVEVSADLAHAKVYITVRGGGREEKSTMHGLKSAAGYIGAKVADYLQTRTTPTLTFHLDEGFRNSLEVTRLLQEEGLIQRPAPAEAAEDADTADEVDAPDDDESEPAEAAGDGPPGRSPT